MAREPAAITLTSRTHDKVSSAARAEMRGESVPFLAAMAVEDDAGQVSELSNVEWFDRPGGEPVELYQPSPQWIELADHWIAEVERVLSALRPRVEHIGSTAVPGLIAKPVIDLQVSVPDIEDEMAYRPALESLGLALRAREWGHRYFRPPAGQPRTVHVHVCELGSTWEQEHLVFRDQLRARPELAAAYAELKHRLAAAVGTDREAYTDGKSDFVRRVVDSAQRYT